MQTLRPLSELITEKRWPEESDIWPHTWNRGSGLLDLCNDVFGSYNPSHQIADVGVARGISTQIFAHFGHVTGVDHQIWDEAKAIQGHPRITLMQEDTFEAARFFHGKQQFDLVHLDTIHEEGWLSEEIRLWLPNVRPGGYIGGHDANNWFPGVTAAIVKTLGGWDRIYSDGSWVKKIP